MKGDHQKFRALPLDNTLATDFIYIENLKGAEGVALGKILLG